MSYGFVFCHDTLVCFSLGSVLILLGGVMVF